MNKEILYVLVFYGEICNIWTPRNCEACKQRERGLCDDPSFIGFNLIIDKKEQFEKAVEIEEIEEYLKDHELLNREHMSKIELLKMTDFTDSNVFTVDRSDIVFEGEGRVDCLVKKPQFINIILPQ